jgi:hypothetical protein
MLKILMVHMLVKDTMMELMLDNSEQSENMLLANLESTLFTTARALEAL